MRSRQLLLFVTEIWLVCIIPLSATAGNIVNYQPERRNLAPANSGSISIDCGLDQDYVDKETGIFYRSDRDFISTGDNQEIAPEYEDENPYFRRILQSVRYFPEGRKNCYTLLPEYGKNRSYYIRVFFMYGNYDGKHQIPKFDMYLGVNYWSRMQPVNASLMGILEMVHLALTDNIYVCLVNTGSGTPFISALELRPLNKFSYGNESRSLSTLLLYDLGKSQNMVRYKDDVYDRAWITFTPPNCISINTTAEIEVGSNDSYKAPMEVWRTAAQPRNPLRSMDFPPGSVIDFQEYYVCFHFAELTRIPQGQLREFIIILNDVTYGPYTLKYLKPFSICPRKSPVKEYFRFSINATRRSHLPPILNAVEVFGIMPPPDSPTDINDVEAITTIIQSYNIKRDEWQGDPCLPRDLSWNGLSCSYESNVPRMLSLNLSSNGLKGKISSSFSNLKALQSLDLSYNELTGTVPEFLALLPNLTTLNLTGNKLSGPVPQSLIEKSNNAELQLSLVGNPNLCLTAYSCNKKKHSSLLPITLSAISILVILLFSCTLIYLRTSRQRARTQSKNNEGSSVISKQWSVNWSEIVSITENFKTIIGEGGFGKVYFGTLKDNTQVAVKLLSQNSRQGYKEFKSEAQLLMVVHHRNLVSLIGYCDDPHNKALIYEYMPCGNLRQHLSETSGNILNWNERLQIAVDAAHGLDYLHNGCKPPIVHRDLKTSNILLNEKLQAKIADFGLSRAFSNESNSHITTRPAGTIGYVDPEAQASGNFNKKSDVYSFGIVLLELMTGQPAIKRDETGDVVRIQQWVAPIIERGDIRSIVDPRLQEVFETNSAWKTVEIALSCVLNSATERPDMDYVLIELKECLAMGMTRLTLNSSPEKRSYEIDSDMVPSPR